MPIWYQKQVQTDNGRLSMVMVIVQRIDQKQKYLYKPPVHASCKIFSFLDLW